MKAEKAMTCYETRGPLYVGAVQALEAGRVYTAGAVQQAIAGACQLQDLDDADGRLAAALASGLLREAE